MVWKIESAGQVQIPSIVVVLALFLITINGVFGGLTFLSCYPHFFFILLNFEINNNWPKWRSVIKEKIVPPIGIEPASLFSAKLALL